MKTLIFILLCNLIPLISFASEELSVFSRIDREGSSYVLHKADTDQVIPSVPGNDEVKEMLSKLSGTTEAIVRGHITYQMTGGDDGRSLRPYFVITEIRPISLGEIGKVPMELPELTLAARPEPLYPRSPTFPVTTEVASAITLTSTMLLMNSLTSGDDPNTQDQIRTGLFLSAGAMATILFIYDQLSGKTKP